MANTIRLLALPDTVRDLVRKGVLSAGHARPLIGNPEAERLAGQIVARGLNVRQTEALAAAKPKPEATSRGGPRDPETASLERELSDRLGLRVGISHEARGGRVTIRYRDLDQLDGLIRLLNGGG